MQELDGQTGHEAMVTRINNQTLCNHVVTELISISTAGSTSVSPDSSNHDR